MLIFEPDDTSSLFQLPLYDVSKLHTRLLYESKTVANGLTSIVQASSMALELGTKLECMIYAYSVGLTYLQELFIGGAANDYYNEYSTIFKGFALHSLNPILNNVLQRYKSSPLSFCESRFALYRRKLIEERQRDSPVNYAMLITIFYKQPLKVIRQFDIPDDGDLTRSDVNFNTYDDDLEAAFKVVLEESRNYIENKIEEFLGFNDL